MKKMICLVMAIFSFFTLYINVYAEDFYIYSEKALLINLNDNQILYEKNNDIKTSIASLTKIITAIISIENIEDLNQLVTITEEDLKGLVEENASVAGFKVGDKVSYEELLYGLMLPSGADSAQALARNLFGSVDKFVSEMNNFVNKLNLKNTHFANPTGLDDEDNYSTLDDLAIIFEYALKNDEFKKIIMASDYTTQNNIELESTAKKVMAKHNINMDYFKGGKTGTTEDAGLCLASIASYGGVDYMLITVNAPYAYPYDYHIKDAETIYNYYINNYSYQPIINKNDSLITLNTKYVNPDKIEIKSTETIKKYLPNSFNIDNIKFEYDGVKDITPIYKKGDVLGTINIIYNDEILDKIEVKLENNLTINLKEYFNDNKQKCIVIILTVSIFSLIIIKLIFPKKKKRKKKK